MKNTLTSMFIFAAGASIGSFVTWKLLKTKYDQLIQEEIESVKEAFSKAATDAEEKSEPEMLTEQEEFKETHKEYCEIVAESGYTNGEKGGSELMEGIKPYVIPPEDYGEIEDYEQVTFNYYADGVLAMEYVDKDGNLAYDVIDDVENSVGKDSLTRFGEYEPDSVHVRNDRLECDYEILKDYRNFSELVSQDGNQTPFPEVEE